MIGPLMIGPLVIGTLMKLGRQKALVETGLLNDDSWASRYLRM